MERDLTITGDSKQVFIAPPVGMDDELVEDGLKFELWIDIPSRRSYELRKFLNYYFNELFNEWTGGHCTMITYEPCHATVVFHDTVKGREMATMFKLTHQEYPYSHSTDVIWS